MKTLIGICALVLLSACDNSVPQVSFDRPTCKQELTGVTRRVQRQGPCIAHSRIGNTDHCTAHSHYWVTQLQQRVSCTKTEWTR